MQFKGWMVWILAAVILLLWGIASFNSLVKQEEKVNSAWSQVDVQLQRRADLIPNLVETVKGYAAHEQQIMAAVSDARARLAGAQNFSQRLESEQQLTGALSRLLAVVENYPNLKADANFRQLSDELAGTENRIAVANRDYNEAVRVYNSRRRGFPASLIANQYGFGPRDYFEARPGAKEVPQVKF